MNPIKPALSGHYEGTNVLLGGINEIGKLLTFQIEVPGLHNEIIGNNGLPIAAFYKIELLGAAGTAILLAAIVTKFIAQMSAKDFSSTFAEAMNELAKPILMISSVVAFAYVTNASGMSTTLGMTLAKSGICFRSLPRF